MTDWGINQDGDGDGGGLTTWERHPPSAGPKKSIRRNSGGLLHTVSDRGP